MLFSILYPLSVVRHPVSPCYCHAKYRIAQHQFPVTCAHWPPCWCVALIKGREAAST